MTGHFLYYIRILRGGGGRGLTLFRDIDENNGLKLQLFYKQLALGI